MVELSALPRRSTTGIAFSAVLHVIMGASVAGLASSRAARQPPSESRPVHLVYTPDVVRAVLIPPSAFEPAGIASTPPAPLPPPPAEAPAPAVPERVAPAPVAVPVPATVLDAASLPALPPALMTPPPPVTRLDALNPAADVQVKAVVGTFDERRESASRRRPVEPQARSVAVAGFGSAEPVRAMASDRSGVVQPGGFDVRNAAPAAAPPSRQPIDTPVAIVFKPEPRYTDEAKALKIEGQVVLDVEFAATGEVRVLAVVRGLGHGLDEAAARATEQIRFRPAKAGGSAVDFRTTVHVEFRLS